MAKYPLFRGEMFRFDSKQVGRYLAISQIGFVMVGPIVLGVLADSYWNWSPWGVIVGAVLGLVVGLYQLVGVLNKAELDDDANEESQ